MFIKQILKLFIHGLHSLAERYLLISRPEVKLKEGLNVCKKAKTVVSVDVTRLSDGSYFNGFL